MLQSDAVSLPFPVGLSSWGRRTIEQRRHSEHKLGRLSHQLDRVCDVDGNATVVCQ